MKDLVDSEEEFKWPESIRCSDCGELVEMWDVGGLSYTI